RGLRALDRTRRFSAKNGRIAHLCGADLWRDSAPMLPSPRPTVLAAVAAAVLLPAAGASAKDFCVAVPGCASGYVAIQPALDAAKANPGHDRVLIGAGVWTTNNAADDDVTIEGSGSG